MEIFLMLNGIKMGSFYEQTRCDPSGCILKVDSLI